jgi:uncharacterized membrane protein YgcG
MGGDKDMTGIIYIIFLFVIVSLVMSMFRNQGRNYRGRDLGSNDQYMHTNNTMHNGNGDMNFNGVPDYMEQNQMDRDHDGIPDHLEPHNVDADHDGIPDYMDPNPGSFDGSSNDTGSFFDNGNFNSGNDYTSNDFDSGSSFDSGSVDTGSFDSGSFDAGGSDFGGGTVD